MVAVEIDPMAHKYETGPVVDSSELECLLEWRLHTHFTLM